MTAEEKAEQLTHRFYEIENDSQYYGVNWKIAKQCALIAVDEILDSSPMYNTGFEYESNLDYWNEVKNEIEKL